MKLKVDRPAYHRGTPCDCYFVLTLCHRSIWLTLWVGHGGARLVGEVKSCRELKSRYAVWWTMTVNDDNLPTQSSLNSSLILGRFVFANLPCHDHLGFSRDSPGSYSAGLSILTVAVVSLRWGFNDERLSILDKFGFCISSRAVHDGGYLCRA